MHKPHTQEIGQDSSSDGQILSDLPDEFGTVAIAVYRVIAAALPSLARLSVGRDVGNSAISAFGLVCRKLCSLELNLLSSSTAATTAALQDVSQHLPNLTHLKLTGEHSLSVNYGTRISAALVYLQACPKLAVLVVDVGGTPFWMDMPDSWNLLPASLQEFSCSDPMLTVMSPALCARLKRLTLWTLCDSSIGEFMHRNPLLQEFTLRWDLCVQLLCFKRSTASSGNLSLQQRFETGFKLCCPHLGLSGLSDVVRDTLEWLPPLLSVRTCSMRLTGEANDNFLQEIARVFPKLELMSLNAEFHRDDPPVNVDVQALSSLADCKSLTELRIGVNVKGLTMAWLVDLCNSLPALKALMFHKHFWMDDLRLQNSCICLPGREVKVWDNCQINVPGVDDHGLFGNG